MNEIEQMMKEAHIQYLQDKWDAYLIEGWRKENWITYKTVSCFVKKHNITFDEFYKLRRVPLTLLQQRTMITRFIAAYLPQLNNILWAGNASDELIFAAMKKMRTLRNPHDAKKCAKETLKRKKAHDEANAQKTSYLLVKGQREYTSKSNWNHCK